MRILRRALFIVIALVAVVFAVSNRGTVTLNLWPLPFEAALPVYLVVLGAAGLGLILGVTVSWLAKERMWLRARSAERRADGLQREVTVRRPAAPPARAALSPAARAARLDDE
ncbi:MAG: DUF1049 domain-containing protein [Alphaproteobacteria bacterium]|nr:DUF1049 domain-containing protein [Alphaproteobacteria bacterium]